MAALTTSDFTFISQSDLDYFNTGRGGNGQPELLQQDPNAEYNTIFFPLSENPLYGHFIIKAYDMARRIASATFGGSTASPSSIGSIFNLSSSQIRGSSGPFYMLNQAIYNLCQYAKIPSTGTISDVIIDRSANFRTWLNYKGYTSPSMPSSFSPTNPQSGQPLDPSAFASAPYTTLRDNLAIALQCQSVATLYALDLNVDTFDWDLPELATATFTITGDGDLDSPTPSGAYSYITRRKRFYDSQSQPYYKQKNIRTNFTFRDYELGSVGVEKPFPDYNGKTAIQGRTLSMLLALYGNSRGDSSSTQNQRKTIYKFYRTLPGTFSSPGPNRQTIHLNQSVANDIISLEGSLNFSFPSANDYDFWEIYYQPTFYFFASPIQP